MLINDITSRVISDKVRHSVRQQIPDTGSFAFVLSRTLNLIRGRAETPLEIFGKFQALCFGIPTTYKSVVVLGVWLWVRRWFWSWSNSGGDRACCDGTYHVPERREGIRREIGAVVGSRLCRGIEACGCVARR